MAWAVRGRSSSVFARSVWRGPHEARRIALTFDDGPSPRTPELLDLLSKLQIPATFFVCGVHVRRLPSVVAEAHQRGSEIGNHTENHARLWLRTAASIRTEVGTAHRRIADVTGSDPRWFRAPYGVRWPGLGGVQRDLGLTNVMWTVIGKDWMLPAPQIASRLLTRAAPGGILCLHDGRELHPDPDISATVDAVRIAVPKLIEAGYSFVTLTEMFRHE